MHASQKDSVIYQRRSANLEVDFLDLVFDRSRVASLAISFLCVIRPWR
jgi:hypothetical protein